MYGLVSRKIPMLIFYIPNIMIVYKSVGRSATNYHIFWIQGGMYLPAPTHPPPFVLP